MISNLAHHAWEEFRRQTRVTQYFDKRESINGVKECKQETPKRREKIYVPKIMMDMMLATTGNGTSIHFGMGHMCKRH